MGNILTIVVLCAIFIPFIAHQFKLLKQIKLEKKIVEQKAYNYEAILYNKVKHGSGLPLVEGVLVDIYYTPDKFVFVSKGQEIIVSREKIIRVDIASGKDIESQQALGAVAGQAIIGGVTGAVIGSLLAGSVYLAITYHSDAEIKYIFLDLYKSGTFASKIEKDFNKTAPQKNTTITL